MRRMLVVAILLAIVLPTQGLADPRLLRLHELHRDDDLTVRPFGRFGIPARAAWLRLSRFWRARSQAMLDRRGQPTIACDLASSGGTCGPLARSSRASRPPLPGGLPPVPTPGRRGFERIPVHPRLLRVLVHVQRHFGARRIDLLSGYRAPEDPKSLSSYHQVGQAADVSIDGIEPRELFEYCRELQSSMGDGLGCGLYPNRRFVHVDARSRSVIWVDLGHGSYVSDAVRWLREHPDVGRW